MSLMRLVTTFSPKSKILTKKNDNLDLFETTVYVQIFSNVSYFSSLFFHLLLFLLQQLMRERQQMASRPFASVAVALDVGGTQVELLQGGIEVSFTFERGIHPVRF